MSFRGFLKKFTVRILITAMLFSALPFSVSRAQTAAEPDISSDGAVLYNATSGKFLYEKNADKAYYPASVTKILTALLVLENCSLDDTVNFSAAATTNLESGAVTLNLTEGDKVSVKDCLYAILLKSANEAANGLAEHVSGSVSAFADLMNKRAKQLGCTGSHFANPNGLDDTDHYTTPHDMALIAKACFDNSTFCTIDHTTSYQFPATINRPEGTLLVMGHKMIDSGNSQYYNGVIGGKTGYTSAAGNTLVTCAERNGVRLIAVVMKSRSTHYADTKALLDYGFALQGQDKGTSPVTSPVTSPGSAGTSSASTGTSSAETVAAVSETVSSSSGPGAQSAGWHQDGDKWYYVKDGGAEARSERLTINGFEYWFDADGTMATGWRKDAGGGWYYMRPSFGGMKKSAWISYNGVWYYLGPDGKMFSDTITPDGYRVDGQGAWIE